MTGSDRGYSAFVSYSHVDRRWAEWLHRSLERFRPPKSLGGAVGADGRLRPVFIDRAELASSNDLSGAVRDALDRSDHLIVVCSPASAQSRWVNQEIRLFRALKAKPSIFCLIVAGTPHVAANGGDAADECFPPALFEGEQPGEPLAADIRPGHDHRTVAKFKILAGLLGVGLDDLTHRHARRRQRQLAAIAIAATFGLAVMTLLMVIAVISRQRALDAQGRAERARMTAERTADFIKGLFRQSDPSAARGNSVTAREVLDRGARRIAFDLHDQPLVRADLTATLGEVYASLGLYHEGLGLLRTARSLPGQDAAARARAATSTAEILFDQGDYPRAETLARAALVDARQGKEEGAALEPRALLALGQVLTATGRPAAARQTLDAAFRLATARAGPASVDAALALEAIGVNAVDEGRLNAADRLFRRAAAIRLKIGGASDPGYSDDLNQLGSITYLRGDPRSAERYYERALAIDRRVLGEKHPDLAVTLQNLARMKLERRDFRGAAPLLEQAIAITVAQRASDNDDLAFFYANLAIARVGLGDAAAAEPLFQRAIAIARARKHRNLAPALTELADLECRTGRVSRGLDHLAEALPIMRATYPDDAWRSAEVANVEGACLVRAGRHDEGGALLRSSTPTILARWPSGTLYGHAASMRLRSAQQPR